MNLSKTCKLALLASFACLLLTVFNGAIYGQTTTINWSLSAIPTEVINTGRSELSASITLTVVNPEISNGGYITSGNPLGGPSQMLVNYGPTTGIYAGPATQIDNNTDTGIRVYGPKFASAGKPLSIAVANTTTFGAQYCSGQIQVFIPGGVQLVYGDIIKIEGVRLRVDLLGVPLNTDIYARMQSVDSTNLISPDTVKVATTFPGMYVGTSSDTGMLCFLNWGSPTSKDTFLKQNITITEGFYRAFVAKDANFDNAATLLDRLDSGGPLATTPVGNAAWLGGGPPAGGINVNGTMVKLYLSGIPNSVVSVSWPAQVFSNIPGNVSWFQEIPSSESFTTGVAGGANNGFASAVYEYFTKDQTGNSDINLENFKFSPALKLSSSNQQDTGIVLAGATLWPLADSASACGSPHGATDSSSSGFFYGHPFSGYAGFNGNSQPYFDSSHYGKPRFALLWQSSSGATGNIDASNQLPSNFGVYEQIISCRCFLLFPYVTATPYYNTGIAVANTSMDTQVFGKSLGATPETGTVTFWLYDSVNKSLNSTGINLPATTPGQGGYAVDVNGTPVYAPGQSFIGLVSQLVALTATKPASFSGYMIAQANFQYCHGFAFVADSAFATIAQGYIAPIIPDPAVKTTYRTASAAADVVTKLLAGESLNN